MNFFGIYIYFSNFDKYDKTQLLAKFKNILYIGSKATLNSQNFKVALYQKLHLIMLIKEVSANCFCASLLRTQIHTPCHA